MNSGTIVTVTPSPSIDRTVTLGTPLTRGGVHRVQWISSEPGGKGVNITRALTLAGLDSMAVLPAAASDPMVAALHSAGVPFRCVPISAGVRTNLAIIENDGTTTKFNEPGAALDRAALDVLTQTILEAADSAAWVVLSGSLPTDVPERWYADIVALLAPYECRVAVDTCDAPLAALASTLDHAAPDLIKPNAEELAGLVGVSAQILKDAAAQGDPTPVISASLDLVGRGVAAVLTTLGPAGAVLVNATGAWLATPPPIVPISTVGAGDSSLAGYLRADVGGAEAPRRLQMAVAYGSAAAALPGSTLPSPNQVDLDGVRVVSISTNLR